MVSLKAQCKYLVKEASLHVFFTARKEKLIFFPLLSDYWGLRGESWLRFIRCHNLEISFWMMRHTEQKTGFKGE